MPTKNCYGNHAFTKQGKCQWCGVEKTDYRTVSDGNQNSLIAEYRSRGNRIGQLEQAIINLQKENRQLLEHIKSNELKPDGSNMTNVQLIEAMKECYKVLVRRRIRPVTSHQNNISCEILFYPL